MLFALFVVGVAALELTASTQSVAVEFQGSSGGFKLFPVGVDKFIQVQQDSLQEVDATGKKVGGQQFNPAGGSFVAVETNNSLVSQSIFTKEQHGITFEMSCLLSQADTKVFDRVMNGTVNVVANALKFSVAITGWKFEDIANTLTYSIIIKDKNGNGADVSDNANVTAPKKKFSLGDGAMETPLTATADGKEVTVGVTYSTKGNKNIITFVFPHFKSSLQYDPDVTVEGQAVVPAPTTPPAPTEEEEEGFDFGSGCLAGEGDFSVTLKTVFDTQDLPGIIPADKWGVRVNLFSTNDIDIQLLDMEYTPSGYTEGAAIVAYCEPEPGQTTCNNGPLGTAPGVDSTDYFRPGMSAPLAIEYSGYNGVSSLGDEYIQITGVTPIPTKMRVYAYSPGPATVTYSWERSRSRCCCGEERCLGEAFSKNIVVGELATIGVIPVGKINVRIDLTSEADVDVQIYNMDDVGDYSEGKALIGYCAPPPGEATCNVGELNGPVRQEWVFDDVTYVYSGYNGVDGRLGDEYIEVIGTTNHPLLMKAYGYRSGTADVTYSWLEQSTVCA